MPKHGGDDDGKPVKPEELPTYPCQHTGKVVYNSRIVCSGCGQDYGPAQGS